MADTLGQARFDGMTIDIYGGSFLGGFDLDANIALDQKLDQEVYFVIRARMSGAQIKETKSGDLRRTNQYSVTDCTPLTPDLGAKLQALDGRDVQLTFTTDLLDGLVDDEEADDPDD